MEIVITTKNFALSDDLQLHIKTRLEPTVKKYIGPDVFCKILIQKDGLNFSSKISITYISDESKLSSFSDGSILFVNSNADDPFTSFDNSISKCEKKLRKYNSNIKQYIQHLKNNSKKPSPLIEKCSIDPLSITDIRYMDVHSAGQHSTTKTSNVRDIFIIEKKGITVEQLSLREAMMRLDLLSLPAMVFVNAETKDLDVVYYKNDGNISWLNGLHALSNDVNHRMESVDTQVSKELINLSSFMTIKKTGKTSPTAKKPSDKAKVSAKVISKATPVAKTASLSKASVKKPVAKKEPAKTIKTTATKAKVVKKASSPVSSAKAKSSTSTASIAKKPVAKKVSSAKATTIKAKTTVAKAPVKVASKAASPAKSKTPISKSTVKKVTLTPIKGGKVLPASSKMKASKTSSLAKTASKKS